MKMKMNIINENTFYADANLKDGLYVVKGDEKLYLGTANGKR